MRSTEPKRAGLSKVAARRYGAFAPGRAGAWTTLAVCAAAACAGALFAQPAGDLNPPRQEPDAPLAADEMEFTQFSDPVDLQALVDLVSKRLGVNIITTDVGLSGQQVVFRAPMRVKDDQLLSLLQLLLESHQYTLTKDADTGWYVIRPAAALPVNLDGELATTLVIPTPLVRPTAVQGMLTQAMPADLTTAKIAFMDELGVIVTTAPPRTNQSLATLVDLIVEGAKGRRLHRFDMQHVAAAEAKDRIHDLVGQAGQQGAARAPGAAAAPTGVAIGPGAGLSNLGERLIIDRRGNSLIFSGNESEAEEVKKYIELVDSPSRMVIRRYNAGPLSATIARYGESMGLGPVVQAQTGGTGAGAARAGGLTGVGAATQAVGSRFEVEDAQSGAFTYFGTLAQHDKVAALVDEFADQARGATMEVRFFKLRHGNAEEMAETINQLLEAETGQQAARGAFLPQGVDGGRRTRGVQRVGTDIGVRDTQPTGGVTTTLTGPGTSSVTGGEGTEAAGEEPTGLTPVEGISVIADLPNNQLIIRAPARQQAEFARIIDQLDQRRPQVFIDVKIVSVDATKTFEFSVDYAVGGDGPGDFPLFTNFGLRQGEPFDNIELPDPMGVTFAVIRNSYIPVVINALQTEGDARIVSSPRLLVNDNEEASLSSTEDQPFAQTTQTAGAPSQTSLGGTLSAGTQLTITPTISEAGFMIMTLSAELSRFGAQPNPDLPPVRFSNNFDSVVTVPGDSTVVVGGFSFTTKTSTVNKFPILGDIPGIGLLFRHTTERESMQTIYVFLTPRILRDPTFTDLRLLSKGPMHDFEVEDVTPELEPVAMPILGRAATDEGEGEPALSEADSRANDDPGRR